MKPTPWISSSLKKPAVTPFTMPAMMERAVPYMAFAKRVSPIGTTTTFLSVMVMVSPALRKASSRRRWLSVSKLMSVVSKMVASGLNHTVVPRPSVTPISVTSC